MRRFVGFFCVFLLTPGCAQTMQNSKEVADAAAEYKASNDGFAALQAENTAKAEKGWVDGSALHDQYMAAPAPEPATSASEAQAWYDQRHGIIAQTDQHFANVQMHGEPKRGFMTHLKLGDMERRLVDELRGFEATLSADDGRTMYSGTFTVIETAIAHYSAWDGHYREDDDGTLARKFSAEIEAAAKHRETLEVAYDRSVEIVMGDLKTKEDE